MALKVTNLAWKRMKEKSFRIILYITICSLFVLCVCVQEENTY